MPRPKVISEEPITMAELASKLSKIRERDGELNFRANKTEEYLNNFRSTANASKISSSLDVKKALELKDKLRDLNISRLKEDQITKLIDLLPCTTQDLKVILQGYTLTLNKDSAKKIVEVVSEFAS